MTTLELKRVPDGWEVRTPRADVRIARFIGTGSKRRALNYVRLQGATLKAN